MVKMRIKAMHIIVLVIAIGIGAVYYFLTPKGPGKYDEFAPCLTERGAIMYGTFWCPNCNSQKSMFSSSFKYIEYVECDPRGNKANPALCEVNNIQNVPTWIINGTKYVGVQSLQKLSSISGCHLQQTN